MLLTKFVNIGIAGISVAAPNQLIPVEAFNERFGEETVSNVSSVTGIKSFYRTTHNQTASDLGFEAAQDLIKKSAINPDEIGMLIFVTQKPDYRLPSSAFLIHKRLGLGRGCSCFDINLACSGFVYGLHTAMSMLTYSDSKYALLITADTSIKTISPEDRTMMLLFGDSGTATLLHKTDSTNESFTALRSDGDRFKTIITPAGAFRNRNAPKEPTIWGDGIMRSDYDTHMKGMDVFGFSIADVPKLMAEFMKELGTSPETYDCFALHQPNLYMLKKIAHKLKISDEKLLVSIERFGNNSSSSIPLVLADRYGAEANGVIRTLICGFGSGLSWACGDISLEVNCIHPIIFSDNYYQPER
jgi:3-oxoacyl-[acyl-carrier-protein] synthase III